MVLSKKIERIKEILNWLKKKKKYFLFSIFVISFKKMTLVIRYVFRPCCRKFCIEWERKKEQIMWQCYSRFLNKRRYLRKGYSQPSSNEFISFRDFKTAS